MFGRVLGVSGVRKCVVNRVERCFSGMLVVEIGSFMIECIIDGFMGDGIRYDVVVLGNFFMFIMR